MASSSRQFIDLNEKQEWLLFLQGGDQATDRFEPCKKSYVYRRLHADLASLGQIQMQIIKLKVNYLASSLTKE